MQHLAAVGKALFEEEKQTLKAWLKPLVRQLKKEPAVKVIGQLEQLPEKLPEGLLLRKC